MVSEFRKRQIAYQAKQDEYEFTQYKKSKKPQIQSNGFCFTVQNWTEEDEAFVASLYHDDVNCKYLIIGWEKASRTKTRHLQCYIYYTKKVDYNKFKKFIAPYHLEEQKSKKNVAAYVYCMEDEDFYEFGDRPRQGHRTDLEAIKHDLLKKKSLSQISREYFNQYCQYSRQFEKFIEINNLRETYDTIVYEYDYDDLKAIYKDYNNQDNKIYISRYIEVDDFYHNYYSGKYKNIFVHAQTVESNQIFDRIDVQTYEKKDID